MSLDSSELRQQIELICIERGLDPEEIMKSIETSIAGAYRKEFGSKDRTYEAKFNLDKGTYSIFRTIEVVDEVEFPEREVSVVEARLTNPNAVLGDVLREEVSVNEEVHFGRIASQVAKQVLMQTINSIKHTKVLNQFKDRIGEVVTVEVDHFKKGGYSVKLAQTVGYISKEHLMPIDRFKPGQLVKALILDIIEDKKGSRIILSRTDKDFVKAVISKEVPEVASGIVSIDKIVREPGFRSKLLVSVNEDEDQVIDPVGTILGRKNVRILNIMREINTSMQEKIDIIENRPDELEGMIMDALEPAEIERVDIDEEKKEAIVYCYPEEASLAVGRRGVNIKLAGELLEYNLSIQTLDDDGNTEDKAAIITED
jgi:N utilization substance protein A